MTLQSMFGLNDSYKESTYRESVTTFKFIAELMEALANRNKKVDVLMTKSGDKFGYDVVLHCDGQSKYIQLKTTVNTKVWRNIHTSLINNPHGEIIIMYLVFSNPTKWDVKYRPLDKSKLTIDNTKQRQKIDKSMLHKQMNVFALSKYLFP